MKKALWLALLLIAGLVIQHGVPLPRWVWQPVLSQLQAQLPHHSLDVARVVVGLSHNPRVLLTGLSLQSRNKADSLQLDLVKVVWRLQLNSASSPIWVLDDVTIKGLHSTKQLPDESESSPFTSLHLHNLSVLSALRLAFPNALQTAGSQPPNWDVRQSDWTWTQKGQATYRFEIEKALWPSPDAQTSTNRPLAAFKWMDLTQSDQTVYVSAQAESASPPHNVQSDFSAKLTKIQLDITANWNKLPWVANVAVGQLLLQQPANSLTLKLVASELRSYVRRDDEPDTHQAALSAQLLEGGLPKQDWTAKGAEWTYTHEDAQAWTFDANWRWDKQQLQIVPATLPGSEALPAEGQLRSPLCLGQQPQALWFWQNNWFRNQKLAQTPRPPEWSLALCTQANTAP